MNDPIMMTEEYWMNSPYSTIRHYGRGRINGKVFYIVNKEGKDVWQCTAEAEKAGRTKAIEPGEPCDLVREDFIPLYRKLGRDRFMQVLIGHPIMNDSEIKKIMEGEVK